MSDDWVPPVQTLRAFVAAVRTGSFAQAAQELRLTHGAVSHHIARLEHYVGVQLFHRHRRGAQPTTEALKLANKVGRSLNDLRSACLEARQATRQTLAVTMTPAFAQRWLMPRLRSFQSSHADIDLFIRPSAALLDFDVGRIDVAVRYGSGRWKGLESVHLADEFVSPMASPNFRNGDLPQSATEILHAELVRNPKQPWAPWFSAVKLPETEPTDGPIIDDAGLALDVAIKGEGIVLARHILAQSAVDAGQLVKLHPTSVKDVFSYYLVWRKGADQSDPVRSFKGWIISELRSGFKSPPGRAF